MSTEDKEFLKEYFKMGLVMVIVMVTVGAMVFSIYYDHTKQIERIRIESEYSWFLERSGKIELMANYISVLDVDDDKYEGAKELLELSVLEYNTKAVMFTTREKWNCVTPYQYSMTELLYRGVVRVGNNDGRDSK